MKDSFIKNVAVVGAGTMGNGIAHMFAQNGFAVTLVDVNIQQLEKAVLTISKNLDRQVAKATILEEQKKRHARKHHYNPRHGRGCKKCAPGY